MAFIWTPTLRIWIILFIIINLNGDEIEALPEVVCGSIDIRNHPSMMSDRRENPRNCTVIEGDLKILLMTNDSLTLQDYEVLRFPHLREIVGSLLIFQVSIIRSLNFFFPNLRVIRGESLMHSYALVVFQNSHLVEIGLSKLTEISKGSVRISDNAKLCFADTINWSLICKEASVVPPAIELNQNPNSCSDRCNASSSKEKRQCTTRSSSTTIACWNFDTCQTVCPQHCVKNGLSCSDEESTTFMTTNNNALISNETFCCHPACLGGCNGPTEKDCFVCRNVFYKGSCLPTCPDDLYTLNGRKCLTRKECIQKKFVKKPKLTVRGKIVQSKRTCEMTCPPGFEQNPVDATECVRCKGICLKACSGATISNLEDAMRLKSCNIIDGALDITIQTRNANLVKKLEDYLGSILEVTHYVKISFTPSIVSLSMLKNLRKIRGDVVWADKYALSIFENVNMAQLWKNEDPARPLIIGNGSVQFENNPLLCANVAQEFLGKLNFLRGSPRDGEEISLGSNGNKAVCDEVKMNLTVHMASAETFVLRWSEFNTTNMDHRYFLGYQLFYKAVEHQNVSIFENRDACTDSWTMIFLNFKERGFFLTNLKPNTLYAFYIKTTVKYAQGSSIRAAISPVVYEKTTFTHPSSPRIVNVESLSEHSLKIDWLKPDMPNGDITHYVLAITPKTDTFAQERNYCDEPPNFSLNSQYAVAVNSVTSSTAPVLKAPPVTMSSAQQQQSLAADDGGSSEHGLLSASRCCECDNALNPYEAIDDADLPERVGFENAIHDFVFGSRMGTAIDRKKRSASESDSFAPNCSSSAAASPDQKCRNQKSGVKKVRAAKMDQVLVDYLVASFHIHSSLHQLLTSDHVIFWENFTGFNANSSKTTLIVNVTNALTFTLDALKHFTSYEIKLFACQDESVAEHFCSRESVRVARTLHVGSADEINSTSIKVENVTNQANLVFIESKRLIKWAAPKHPNGLVVAYEIQYTRLSGEDSIAHVPVPKRRCVNISEYLTYGGCPLSDLQPGEYSLIVRAMSLAHRGPWSNSVNFTVQGRPTLNIPRVIAICSFIVCVVMVFCSGLVYIFYNRGRNQQLDPKYVMKVISANPDYINSDEVYVKDEWELERDSVEQLEPIGKGSFGVVFRGLGENVQSLCGETFGACAIKTVPDKAKVFACMSFLLEANVMKRFRTAHVIKLFGVVSVGQPPWVVMEIMEQGNLRDYLMRRRPESEEEDALPPPTTEELLRMALHIADGMAYLENMKFCHRDLAARNCMVSGDGICKIGDFGMAKDVYDKDYYRPNGKRLMPVRWMAPEALKDAKFTSKTDVWSFGVVLWEMATLAAQPYPGMLNHDVMSFVIDQRRVLDRPKNCPQFIYDLMLLTWQFTPDKRPSFEQLVERLLPYADQEFEENSYYFIQRGVQYDDDYEPDVIKRCGNNYPIMRKIDSTILLQLEHQQVDDQNSEKLNDLHHFTNSDHNSDHEDDRECPNQQLTDRSNNSETCLPVCNNNRRFENFLQNSTPYINGQLHQFSDDFATTRITDMDKNKKHAQSSTQLHLDA